MRTRTGPELGSYFVMGGFGCGQTDCPQGNDDAGMRRQNAKFGCRCCMVPKSELSNVGDEETTEWPRRYKVPMDDIRQSTEDLGVGAAEAKLKDHGLHPRGSIYKSLKVDEWTQLPHDPFHLFVIGLTMLLLSFFARSLTPQALAEINVLLAASTPWFWNPIAPLQLTAAKGLKKRKLKGCGENARSQIQILPIVIEGWLTASKFSKLWLADLMETHLTKESAVAAVCDSIKTMAWAYRCVFAHSFSTENIGTTVNDAVKSAKCAMKKCWEGIRGITLKAVTNFHSADHTAELTWLFGSIRLCSCARGEAKHCCLKRMNGHCNHRRPEYDMLLGQNISWAVKFLIAGGAVHLRNHLYCPKFLKLIESSTVLQKIMKMASSVDTYVGRGTSETDHAEVCTVNVILRGKKQEAGETTFKYALVPDREQFATKVQAGQFFWAFDENVIERVAMVNKIYTTDSIDEIKDSLLSTSKSWSVDMKYVLVELSFLEPHETLDNRLFLQPNSKTTCMVAHVVRPAHVLPAYDDSSMDGIEQIFCLNKYFAK